MKKTIKKSVKKKVKDDPKDVVKTFTLQQGGVDRRIFDKFIEVFKTKTTMRKVPAINKALLLFIETNISEDEYLSFITRIENNN